MNSKVDQPDHGTQKIGSAAVLELIGDRGFYRRDRCFDQIARGGVSVKFLIGLACAVHEVAALGEKFSGRCNHLPLPAMVRAPP